MARMTGKVHENSVQENQNLVLGVSSVTRTVYSVISIYLKESAMKRPNVLA